MDNNLKVTLNEYERLDDLHRNGLFIIQNSKGFCFGVDAVLLSGFVKVKRGETVLDVGTGTGIVPILLSAKTNALKVFGIDFQEQSVLVARRSVALNKLEHVVQIDQGDARQLLNYYKPSSFDVITSNPPYVKEGSGITNQTDAMTIARHEVHLPLETLIENVAKCLKPNGRFYMVHRPTRLVDILATLRQNKLEPKTIRFVHTKQNKKPTLVLVEAIKGANPELNVLPPLIIYDEIGEYTKETYEIYYGELSANI